MGTVLRIYWNDFSLELVHNMVLSLIFGITYISFKTIMDSADFVVGSGRKYGSTMLRFMPKV